MRKNSLVSNIIFILLVNLLANSGCTYRQNHNEPDKPNIILIMADDMGYGEAGCYGQEIIQTPNIDKIADEGMKFTQFYAGSPVCAPSRCVLMTGKHTGHSYIRNNGQPKEKKIIIFTSDNGPAYDRLGGADSDFFNSSGPLSGRKGSLLEGGIREPMVVSWPGKIEPGMVTNLTAAFWDVLPTICEISGSEIPEDIDGVSFLPTLLGENNQEHHEALYWEFPAYGGQAAMISGDWKLLVRNLISQKEPVTVQLFNIKEDIGEQNDLSKENPEMVNILLQEMNKSHIHSELFKFPQLEKFYSQTPETL